MSPRNFIHHTTLSVLVAATLACSGSKTPTGPSPQPVPNPTVVVSSVTVSGQRHTTGYEYRTVVHLRESGGVTASILSVNLAFQNGAMTTVSSHHDQPIGQGTNVCPANGTIATRELITLDNDAMHPYATAIHVTVSYSDGAAYAANTTGTADVPPLEAPPLPQTYALTGLITDAATHSGIEAARLEVLGGANAGRTTITDRTGTYVIRDLIADTFRLRASANDYLSGEQGITVPDNPRADFELRRIVDVPCDYVASSPDSSPVSWQGGTSTVTITRKAGVCSWQAATDASWLTFSSGTSGNGNAILSVLVAENPSFNNRSGNIVISWASGTSAVRVQQGPRPDWTCLPVTLSKGPQDFDNVPSTGGTLSVLASAEAFPKEWASACRASISTNVSWISGGGTVEGHAAFTFTVATNPTSAARTGSILMQGPGGTATLTVTQR